MSYYHQYRASFEKPESAKKMHFHVAIGVVMATTIGGVLTQGTCSGSYEQGGNWYCPNAVQAITYTNAGGSGTYDAVSNMANGACDKTPYQYSGPIAPLNQEVWLNAILGFEMSLIAEFEDVAAF